MPAARVGASDRMGGFSPEEKQHSKQNRPVMSLFQLRQTVLLLITATIWGLSFVAQSVGMDHVGPFTFTASRMFLGALVLLPFVLGTARGSPPRIPRSTRAAPRPPT